MNKLLYKIENKLNINQDCVMPKQENKMPTKIVQNCFGCDGHISFLGYEIVIKVLLFM